MKYWEDMQNKWGFSDGEATPHGIEIYREVYIKVINKLAELHGSEFRAVAFNRFGVHNFCFILLHRLADLVNIDIADYVSDVSIDAVSIREHEVDEAMQIAIYEARDMFLDDYVHVVTTIDKNFDDFLDKMKLNEGAS